MWSLLLKNSESCGKHSQRHDNKAVSVAREVKGSGEIESRLDGGGIAGHHLVKQSDPLPYLMISSSILLHFIIVPHLHFHSFICCYNWILFFISFY